MINEQKDDLAMGLLCIFVVPFLLFGVGYVALAILGGMNTPAPRTVVNDYDKPLTVGETWQQGEAFELTVTQIREINWSDQLLVGLSDETRVAYQEKRCRIFDVTFVLKNVGYQGYFYGGKFHPGLLVGVHAVSLREDGSSKTVLPDYGQSVFGRAENDDSLSGGLGVGEILENNHFVVFVEEGIERFEVIFRATEDETAEDLEARRKSGDKTAHEYEMRYQHVIAQ